MRLIPLFFLLLVGCSSIPSKVNVDMDSCAQRGLLDNKHIGTCDSVKLK